MPWLALGYPLLAHLAVVLHSQPLQWAALVWLLAVAMGGALVKLRAWAWITLVGGAAGAWWLVGAGNGMYALYVAPAAIPAALLVAFASSLRAGQTPLVTRIARLMRGGPLPDELLRYTRHVTQLWCVVCAALFISAVALAIWASPPVWSLMTNVIHYVILGSVFVLEFFYRRIRYRHHEHSGLFQYLSRLARTDMRRAP